MVAGSPHDSFTLPQLMDKLQGIYKNDAFTADVVEALDFSPPGGGDNVQHHFEHLAARHAEADDELTDMLDIISELWYDHDMLPHHILEYLQEGWEGEFQGEQDDG